MLELAVNGPLGERRAIVVNDPERSILHICPETGELLKELPWFRAYMDPFWIESSKKRFQPKRFRYFFGCRTVGEMEGLRRRYRKMLRNEFDMSLSEKSLEDMEREFSEALVSGFPVGGQIENESQASVLIDPEHPARSWEEYRRACFEGRVLPKESHLRRIAEAAGYKEGWIYYKKKELGI